MQVSYEELIKQSLSAVKSLKARVAELEAGQAEPIAIVGASCRFSGVDSLDGLYCALLEGRDLVGQVPEGRWPHDLPPTVRHGGFLGDLKGFDADFFRIAPCEARSLDPQQRLLLELAWEALEHAAIDPDSLLAGGCGVFTGLSGQDYYKLLASRPPSEFDSYMLSGTSHSTAAGRLAFVLGLQGPALAVDTACSSSLAAIHLACRSLRTQECDLALAGGVNRIITADYSLSLHQSGMLGPRGRCAAFDAAADGYVRAEGGGMVVLQRLSQALRARRRILAVIRGSAMNHDGRTSGLTVPSGPAQQRVIREALRDAGVQPPEVTYVEAHGTGTALGDPIELEALRAAYDTEPRTNPLSVGSVKSNLGHAEAAAGVAGLLKTALCLQHGQLLGNLHYQQPTPHFPWSQSSLRVPVGCQAWETECGRRLAGVSSFGFSGTNIHVVLEQAPTPEAEPARAGSESRLLPLSARSPQALAQLVEAYIRFLGETAESWADITFTAQHGRAQLSHRAAVVAFSKAEARIALQRLNTTSSLTSTDTVSAAEQTPAQLAALFLQGAHIQWASNGRVVTLPAYPWQRVEHWLACTDLFEQVLAAAAAQPEPPGLQPTPDDFPERLEQFVHHQVRQALQSLGSQPVASQHQRLWRSLQRMVEHDNGRVGPPMHSLLQEAPASACIIQLVARCAAALPAVLQGQQDPLELLFAQDGINLPQLYARAQGLVRLNHRLAAAVERALPPDRVASILEVGGGTGSTTRYLLERLPAQRYQYTFTDIGRHLVAEAREQFARWPVSCRLLDLEGSLSEQGLEASQFDIVVAANVLHATRDVGAALAKLRQVMRPGGFLVLLESTEPRAWVTVVSGMTEGWWCYTDQELRQDSPLLSRDQWIELLRRRGFARAAEVPGRDVDTRILAEQRVLLAQVAPGPQAVNPIAPVVTSPAPKEPALPDILEQLKSLPSQARERALQDFLSASVARVLGHSQSVDPGVGFFDLGIDSLTSLALRNRLQTALGCSLPGSLTFTYPNVEKLAAHLREHHLAAYFAPAEPKGGAIESKLSALESLLDL